MGFLTYKKKNKSSKKLKTHSMTLKLMSLPCRMKTIDTLLVTEYNYIHISRDKCTAITIESC